MKAVKLVTASILVVGISQIFSGLTNVFSNNVCIQEDKKEKIIVDNGVAIMLMSRRDSFDARTAIRETWARGHAGVFFIVGDKTCMVPPAFRKSPFSCESNGTSVPFHYQYPYNKSVDLEEASLEEEAKAHPGLVLVPMIDTYRALPHKLKLGYNWVLEHTNAKWLVKIDDDNVARIPNLVKLLNMYNSSDFVVLGWIRRNLGVPRGGKYADPEYYKSKYPPFANGAEGHAVTRGVAHAVVSYNGFEYQGEDVSLGIWLDEMNIPVQWVNVYPKHFTLTETGDCTDSNASIIGHKLRPSDMRRCFDSSSP